MNRLKNIYKSLTEKKNPQDNTKHITEELYKQNFELAEKNKTLAILRKIDEIILSKVTKIQQIAQQVTNTVASDSGCRAIGLYLLNKKSRSLNMLAISHTQDVQKVNEQFKKKFYPEKISLVKNDFFAQIEEKKEVHVTHSLHNIASPDYTPEEITEAQKLLKIATTIIYPLIVQQEIIGVMVISIEDTESSLLEYQKDLYQRLADVVGIAINNAVLYQRLQEANEKLKQVDQLKDEFISIASHELRTPMTVIKTYLWMIMAEKGGPITEKQKFYLNRAYISTDHLISFVNDMLNVSRIESNKISVTTQPLDIGKLIADILIELKLKADEGKVKLTLTPPPHPLKVMADPDKMKEVVMNLIGNSLKFTPNGGSITVSFEEDENLVKTHISDTGAGISKDDLPKLFQKFGIVGNDYLRKRNSQGTGLGLYISKSIVELHGGKIYAESEGEGKGTTFTFTLKKSTK